MHHSLIPNAHECAHLPPPTAEDYERLDKALNTIFNKGNNEMTEQATPTTDITLDMLEAVGDTSQQTANILLKQDGWSIVKQMQKELLKGINATSLIVLPVQHNIAEVKEKVSDPEGLVKIMNTLRNDIGEVIRSATVLGEAHKDKDGEVTDEELPTVDTISLGYAKLQTVLETAIQPLVLQVADIIEAAGITSLELK